MGAQASQLNGTIGLSTMVSLRGTLEYCERKLVNNGHVDYEEAFNFFATCEKLVLVIRNNFPEALDVKTVLDDVVLELKKHNITPDNTIYAQSACPDEINHTPTDITNMMGDFFGKTFHLGGLAGIPFCGQTGFGAFSHHVPVGGNLFIMFCPHIGLSENGNLGKYSREGQLTEGTACGAAVGALGQCRCGNVPSEHSLGQNKLDYQMNFIIHEVNKHLAEIDSFETENAKQTALVLSIYQIARQMMEEITTTDFAHGPKKGKLIILGGIQINMPMPLPGVFVPLMFEIRSHGQRTIDCMSAFHISKTLMKKSDSGSNLSSLLDALHLKENAVSLRANRINGQDMQVQAIENGIRTMSMSEMMHEASRPEGQENGKSSKSKVSETLPSKSVGGEKKKAPLKVESVEQKLLDYISLKKRVDNGLSTDTYFP
jgi:hypothetical protein